jgi:hypothetical protein
MDGKRTFFFGMNDLPVDPKWEGFTVGDLREFKVEARISFSAVKAGSHLREDRSLRGEGASEKRRGSLSSSFAFPTFHRTKDLGEDIELTILILTRRKVG